MKIKSFLLMTIIVISIMAINCDRIQSPFSPDTAIKEQTNKAVLSGTVILSGTTITNFELIQVVVKGTSLYTNPDGNGDFRIDNLPLGNIVVEIYVKNDVSDIQINNVQSGEEIRITVQVQASNQAVLAHMERNKKSTGVLQVQIQPKKWNLNWVDSEDEIIAKISGVGYDQITPGSVKLVSPTDQTDIIKIGSFDESIGGTYFTAKFYQREAIGLITDPIPGMNYNIIVEYELDGEILYLQDMIEIVGKMPRDSEELSIQINPTKWNTNWEKSSGTVMVKFWGEGYDQIDPDSVFMIGPDDPDVPDDVDVIIPTGSNLTDDHLIVKFAMNEAISIIPDPKPSDKHVIRITDNPDGMGSFNFEYVIEIVGSKK
ncbi:MAG: carboxypeptidase-like regulatory domain-containing protein [Acidobacteriota bacterium]|nr:carboxypeptidase-like regulatory domain-containing protein [Acidobacteriota bacterium]